MSSRIGPRTTIRHHMDPKASIATNVSRCAINNAVMDPTARRPRAQRLMTRHRDESFKPGTKDDKPFRNMSKFISVDGSTTSISKAIQSSSLIAARPPVRKVVPARAKSSVLPSLESTASKSEKIWNSTHSRKVGPSIHDESARGVADFPFAESNDSVDVETSNSSDADVSEFHDDEITSSPATSTPTLESPTLETSTVLRKPQPQAAFLPSPPSDHSSLPEISSPVHSSGKVLKKVLHPTHLGKSSSTSTENRTLLKKWSPKKPAASFLPEKLSPAWPSASGPSPTSIAPKFGAKRRQWPPPAQQIAVAEEEKETEIAPAIDPTIPSKPSLPGPVVVETEEDPQIPDITDLLKDSKKKKRKNKERAMPESSVPAETPVAAEDTVEEELEGDDSATCVPDIVTLLKESSTKKKKKAPVSITPSEGTRRWNAAYKRVVCVSALQKPGMVPRTKSRSEHTRTTVLDDSTHSAPGASLSSSFSLSRDSKTLPSSNDMQRLFMACSSRSSARERSYLNKRATQISTLKMTKIYEMGSPIVRAETMKTLSPRK